MNKSDIIKAAEEAADWLGVEPKPSSYHTRHAYKEALLAWENQMIDNIQLAQSLCKAAELLKQVEVLPEGSEPMVGDLIIYSIYNHVDFVPENQDQPEGRLRIGQSGAINKNDKTIRIVQRNGKPIITKGEV